MLGKLVGEAKGTITGVRVLPGNGVETSIELSGQGQGMLLGHAVVVTGTYQQTLRADKSLFCPVGHVILMAADGEVASWTGFAVGRPTGKPPASRIAPCGHMHSASPKFAPLQAVAMVTEFESKEDGSWHWKLWEWQAGEG